MNGRDLLPGVVLLVALSVFPVAWNLGGPPVTDLMEVRNLVTAREMVDTGRWLIPTMNGALRLEKPPLPTWAAAVAGIGGGFRNLWAMRAPAVLIGILGALAVAMYTKRLGASPVAALAAGLVLVSMFLYAKHARLATWDVPTHAFAMAGIAAFVGAGRRQKPSFAVLSALLLSASFLSKGPVGFGVMVLPWAVSAAIWDRSLLHARRSHIAIVLVLTAIGSAAWPLYVYGHEPGHALAVALRETDAWVNRHVRPVWSYAGFPVFAGVWIPAALAVLVSPIFFREFFSRRDVRATFAWLWLSLLVVSLVPTKKERYLIPVLFPLAILIALWWDRDGRRALSSATRVLRAQLWFAGTAGAAAVCAVPVLVFMGTISAAEGFV
ncbi:MAG: glycosyltransferase family 39 protein, partial [Acidobacteria bacterium]|nr:glycosyltransferase family 39 protein [Acidobacteriota bacterium]